MKASVFLQAENILGEGPVWDDRKQEFLWVDIEARKLQFLKDPSQPIEIHHFNQRIGFAVLSEDPNYVIGLEDGIYAYNRKTQKLNQLTPAGLHPDGIRFNDGKVAPDGNLWAGTMSINDALDQGKLYRLDAKLHLVAMVEPVSISNGLAWNPHLNKMYYIDSPTRKIKSFLFDKKANTAMKPEFSFGIPDHLGFPDGMCIDEDGMLWVAHWDGHCVIRWHPETGQIINKIEIPVPRVTSCTFGGKDLTTLYVTTARAGLDELQLEKYPLSGSVFTIDTITKGDPSAIFKL